MEELPLGLSCLVLPSQPPPPTPPTPRIPCIDKGTECHARSCAFSWPLQMESWGRWPEDPTRHLC